MDVKCYAPFCSTPEKENRYPSYRALGGSPGPGWVPGSVWTDAENVFTVMRFPGPSSPQRVAIPTEPSQPTLPNSQIHTFSSAPRLTSISFSYSPKMKRPKFHIHIICQAASVAQQTKWGLGRSTVEVSTSHAIR